MTPAAELRLDATLAAGIVDHARAELPNEACGLLAGAAATGQARAFHPARNADGSPIRYSLEPEDLVHITFALERAGDELLAIVHSHPRSAAEPSPSDRRAARLYPGTLQLIVSLAAEGEAGLRAWRIGPDGADEVLVRIDQGSSSTTLTAPVARSTTTSSRGAPSSPPER